MRPSEGWAIARRAVKAWNDDYAPSMGAALSYYTLFSIAPLLLIVIALAGLAFGDEAVRGEIFEQLAPRRWKICCRTRTAPARVRSP
jgi:membrane protein